MALLAGCSALEGSGAARQPAPDGSDLSDRRFTSRPAATPTADPRLAEPAGPTAARRALRRALRDLYDARYGEFQTLVRLDDPRGRTIEYEHRGTYDLVALRAAYTSSFRIGGDGMELQVRSTDTDAWFAVTALTGNEQPDRTCWIHPDTDVVREVTGLDLPVAPGVGLPPQVAGLLTAEVTQLNGYGSLVGSTDLYTAAGLLGGGVQRALGIPFDSLARVPAEFYLTGDRITSWSVDYDDLVTAADEAGYLTRRMRRQARSAWPPGQSSHLLTELFRVGEPWTYRSPPRRRTIEMSDVDSFESAMRSCTGLGQSRA